MADPAQPFVHRSVLLGAVLDHLRLQPGARVLDGTVGGGGHAESILAATGPDGLLVGIDRDPAALAAAGERLRRFGPRAVLLHGRFGEMERLASPHAPYDGLLLDVGVSSPQLDHVDRGFSFQHDGPLDMRMDTTAPVDAARFIDEIDEVGLVDVLRRYGEEPRARRIAHAILAGRPWTSTRALADCVASASGWHGGRTHPATRTFQALRIAVNDELNELDRALDAAIHLVRPGGRLCFISFHSLEDRIVKRRLREWAGSDRARDAYGNPVGPCLGHLVSPRGVAGADADPENPRARSARLRCLEVHDPSRVPHLN